MASRDATFLAPAFGAMRSGEGFEGIAGSCLPAGEERLGLGAGWDTAAAKFIAAAALLVAL